MTKVDEEAAAQPTENGPTDGQSANGQQADVQPNGRGAPTPAQLRRFIKSRPYVPLHELRRRFELNGELDEVTPVEGPDGVTVYVGLPERESKVIADLARDGDIGLELSRDPRVPIVIGVYAMRPVARP